MTVYRPEIAQALTDLGIAVELPVGEHLAAGDVESALGAHDPEQLQHAIDTFLDALAIGGPRPASENVSWRGQDLGRGDAIMFYSGRLRIEPIRGSIDLLDLPGSPSLDQVLWSDEYEVEFKVTKNLSYRRHHREMPPDVLTAGRDVFATEEALRQWLHTPAGAWAAGRTPQQLIDEGREADVVGALKGLAHGNFL